MAQANPQELQVFQELSGSSQGTILRQYLNKCIAARTDIREIKGEDIVAQLEARKLFITFIEEDLISKLKKPGEAQEGSDRWD